MPDLSNIKIGDKLYVYQRLGEKRIETVERVMPGGRVQTKTGTFDPVGYLRDDRAGWDCGGDSCCLGFHTVAENTIIWPKPA